MKRFLAFIALIYATIASAAGPQPCFYARGIYAQCFPTNFYVGSPGNTTVGTITHQTAAEIADGFYRNGSGAATASATQTGYTQVFTNRTTSSSGTVFDVEVNYQDAQTADSAVVATNTKSAINVIGDTTVTFATTLKFTDTTKGVFGTATNDVAGSGYIGEYKETLTTGNTSLTNNTVQDVDGASPTAMTLTAGCWDIQGSIIYTMGASTSVTVLSVWIGTATGTSTSGRDLQRNYNTYSTAANVNGGNNFTLVTPVYRVNLSGSQSYYLKTANTFTVSTLTANGIIRATRVR